VNKKVLYDLLFRASAETLLEIAADPKHLGAEIGFFAVLHTNGQEEGIAGMDPARMVRGKTTGRKRLYDQLANCRQTRN
jgi:hypothetical protein